MITPADSYFDQAKNWSDELNALREIALDCGLKEELKWGSPCYTSRAKNIAIIGILKDCCVLSFFKGALLTDPNGILSKPGENTQAARVIRFTSVAEIAKMKPALEAFIEEAIAAEEAGLKAIPDEKPDLVFPDELKEKLDANPALKSAFHALTPGRQRAYVVHFSAAKQSATRTARIEKCTPLILCGKGLNDCTCGLSKRMPQCDGSHKFLK
ncbi:YdeI/OmpD-associated family protein [Akkermansiaceae bacterium]|nr:YdeI/OmpD-associated family protein [Akkermansiaceae bacterium]